jgi:hypothetical protein
MPDDEHEQPVKAATEEMQSEVDEMDERSARLAREVEAARKDWEAQREDDSVPGAPPPEGDDAQSG